MVLYNVTVSVESDIEQEWLHWMRSVHVPEVMATGYFESNRILKLLNDSPDATGFTYAIQYELVSIGHLDEYLQKEAIKLRDRHEKKFGQKIMAFRTVLEEV